MVANRLAYGAMRAPPITKQAPVLGAALAMARGLVAALLCAFATLSATAPASAQSNAGVFTVRGVSVDETAETAAAARSQGFTAASRLGFRQLAERLTLVSDRAMLEALQLTDPQIERMAISVDVEEERRSATRYIARLTVRFDAAQVRGALRSAGLTIVESRAAPVLLVPALDPSTAPETLAVWRDAWVEAGLQEELAPLVIAAAALDAPQDWQAVSSSATAAQASSALVASVSVQGSIVIANITELRPVGQPTARGGVSAQMAGLDSQALRGAMDSLVDQINAVVQNEWKAQAALNLGPRARLAATALYANQREWEQIKSALEAAAATSISEIRIEAVSRQGALISFSFAGNRVSLGETLNRYGVSLEDAAYGPVLRVVQ